MAGIKDKLWKRRFRPWQACDTLMGSAVFQALIEQALLQVHTAFVGSVVRVNGNMATIQPLDMVKSAGGAAKKQAIIENCPVLQKSGVFSQEIRYFVYARNGIFPKPVMERLLYRYPDIMS